MRRVALPVVALIGLPVLLRGADHQSWLKQTAEGSFVQEGGWAPLLFKIEQEEKFNEDRLIPEGPFLQSLLYGAARQDFRVVTLDADECLRT